MGRTGSVGTHVTEDIICCAWRGFLDVRHQVLRSCWPSSSSGQSNGAGVCPNYTQSLHSTQLHVGPDVYPCPWADNIAPPSSKAHWTTSGLSLTLLRPVVLKQVHLVLAAGAGRHCARKPLLLVWPEDPDAAPHSRAFHSWRLIRLAALILVRVICSNPFVEVAWTWQHAVKGMGVASTPAAVMLKQSW